MKRSVHDPLTPAPVSPARMQTHPLADLAQEQESPAAHRALGVASVYAIFVCWTLFAVFVYSRYSQLGDARSYLTGAYDDDSQARTWLVTQIATTVISLVRVDVLAHLVFSLFAASGVAYLVHQSRLHDRFRWPLILLLLVPSFGVWASVVGRESLYIGLLGFFLGAVIGNYRSRSLLRFLVVAVCLAGMIFIRAPFGLAMLLFYVMSVLLSRGPRTGLSTGVQFVVLAMIGLLVLTVAWPQLDAYIQDDVLPKARSYFTIASATTRTWINIGTTGQLFADLWWMLPLSIVGPTPGEVMARPVMLPFLASGLVVMFLLLHGVSQAIRMPRGMARKIAVLAWLPAMIVTLVAYVPFGVYNPGSGIRYAACFLLFIVFPSMLRSALAAEAAGMAAPGQAPPRTHRRGRLLEIQ